MMTLTPEYLVKVIRFVMLLQIMFTDIMSVNQSMSVQYNWSHDKYEYVMFIYA